MTPGWIKPDWPLATSVGACITTRNGGVSEASYASLNLGAHVGDDPQAVARNRAMLRQKLALPAAPRWLEQVHGTEIVELDGQEAGIPRADGSITSTPGVVLTVLTADCLPVLLADTHTSRVAALHAGWRGLADGILEAGVTAMQRPLPTVHAYLGPAIGPAAFEVGDEVRARFLADDPASAQCFRPSPAGRWLADIYALARLRLESAGLKASHIHGGGRCTFSEAESFFSYRRDGETGRMASLIWLP
ncbi:peptidoglycan editing factor PgeF [Thermithiobacillus plumbiphilus]|uniref:Purine nucleoside phosphorylase n=1 Tax=Thermithiobacillus plumbiphilus TaxID=1729899 RepID=A0ABU9D5G2_9PROT